jgi:tetratricopeptide (TPR) repeat protein
MKSRRRQGGCFALRCPLAHFARFRCLFALGFILFTVANLAESQTDSEDAYDYLIEGVYYLINRGDLAQAIPFFQKAMALDSTHPDPYYFAGVSYYQLGGSTASALFYFYEAEKRNIRYDKFKPNRIPEILEKHRDARPAPPSASAAQRSAQIIVKSDSERGVVAVQSGDETVEYELGDKISLEGGRRYTIQLKKKGPGQFLKAFVLAASAVGLMTLR